MGIWPNVTCGLMFPWRFQKMHRFNETRALSRWPELNVRSLFLIANWKRLCRLPLWSLRDWVINNLTRYFRLLSHYSGEDKRLRESTLGHEGAAEELKIGVKLCILTQQKRAEQSQLLRTQMHLVNVRTEGEHICGAKITNVFLFFVGNLSHFI